MNYNDLNFFCQGIHHPETKKTIYYELLLRKKESESIFPEDFHLSIISDLDKHWLYMYWLKKTLIKILENNPKKIFSLNLDPQELEYDSTFLLLEELRRYKHQLIIEITETPPLKRNYPYYSVINEDALKKIIQFGYTVSIDDVGQGINSLSAMFKMKNYFHIIKFSTMVFRKTTSEETLKQIIKLFASIAIQLDKLFVVEGIENQEFAQWLETNISCYHQGYLYSIPKRLQNID